MRLDSALLPKEIYFYRISEYKRKAQSVNERVKKAVEAATDTKVLVIGDKNLGKTPEVFKESFPGKTAMIVLPDKITYDIAGKEVEEAFKNSDVKLAPTYMFDVPGFHAEYKYVEELEPLFKDNDIIPVAIGGGTINDICKLVAAHVNKPYMCVVTAASVDGYTAFGASIIENGAKKTFSCPAPRVVFTDLSVIAGAPKSMTAAGYCDLAAKIPAGADWILADIVGNEAMHDVAWHIVQDGLGDALGDPEGIRDGKISALDKLVEGLMLGGFAIQAMNSTRAASGAEHMISHIFNMRDILFNGRPISHGFQVALGTLATTALYEEAFKFDISNLDVDACVSAWLSLDELKEKIRNRLAGTNFVQRALDESEAKYICKEDLRKELQNLKDNWPEIKAKLQRQLLPLAELKRRFEVVGAPVRPSQVGVSKALMRQIIEEAQLIRRRYNILDFLVRTCLFEKALDGIFGEGGIWKND